MVVDRDFYFDVMRKVKELLDKLNFAPLCLVFTLLVLCFSVLVSILFTLLEIDVMVNTQFDELSPLALFFGAVFLAPVFETFIFQFALIEFGLKGLERLKKSKIHWFVPGLLSAVLFGLAHQYNWNYVFITFFMGLLLAVIYYYTRKRFGVSMAFVMCAVVHGLNNLVAFFGQVLS